MDIFRSKLVLYAIRERITKVDYMLRRLERFFEECSDQTRPCSSTFNEYFLNMKGDKVPAELHNLQEFEDVSLYYCMRSAWEPRYPEGIA